MANNDPLGIGRMGLKPMKINTYGDLVGQSKNDSKRTLGIGDKKRMFARARGKCEVCGKKLPFEEMQVGHMKAWSRGGKTSPKNCVCICYGCNNKMGTMNYEKYMSYTHQKIPDYLQKSKKPKAKATKKKRSSQNNVLGMAPMTFKLSKSSWGI